MNKNNLYKKNLVFVIITLFLITTIIPAYTSGETSTKSLIPKAAGFGQPSDNGILIGPFLISKVYANFQSANGYVYKSDSDRYMEFGFGPYGDGYANLYPPRNWRQNPINESSDIIGYIGHRIFLQTKHFFGKVSYVGDRTIVKGWCITVQMFVDNLVIPPDATLAPTDDSYVNKSNPNQNYGTSEFLEVADSNGTETARSYFKFDLSGIPSKSKIHYALLDFYYCDWEGISEPDVGIYQVSDNWSETYINWNNQPNISSTCEYSNCLLSGDVPYGFYWDITDLVQDWINNNIANNGVALKFCNPCQDNITRRIFKSKESTIENERPILMIYYNRPPYQPAKPQGETYVKIGKEYNYTTWSKDPESDFIYYYIDWGDGTNTGWIRPNPSTGEVTASHSWTEVENYQVKAKAKDGWGAESDWSDPKNVNVSTV